MRRELERNRIESEPQIHPLDGGYYWLFYPDDGSIAWDVLTCHELGFDADVEHVDLWLAVIDRLATGCGPRLNGPAPGSSRISTGWCGRSGMPGGSRSS